MEEDPGRSLLNDSQMTKRHDHKRKNGATLARFFQVPSPHNLSWEEDADRLNHDENFSDNKMQMDSEAKQSRSTSIQLDNNCPTNKEHYYFEATVVSSITYLLF